MPIEPAEFRRVLGHFPTGVTVVAAACDDGPAGLAIGSFASVSLDPPLVMFCPSKSSVSWQRMRTADAFCVNVMGEDQAELCSVFAGSSTDKFGGIDWSPAPTGAPLLGGALSWIDCSRYAVHDGGDHDIVVGRVEAAATAEDLAENPRGPLLFYRGAYGRYSPAD